MDSQIPLGVPGLETSPSKSFNLSSLFRRVLIALSLNRSATACTEEFVQPTADRLASFSEECLIRIDTEQGCVSGNALRFERRRPRPLYYKWNIGFGCFCANLLICPPANKSEICDVVCLAGGIDPFEYALRKNVVKLQFMF